VHGRIWVARSPREGVRYEANEAEMPVWLALMCDVCSMRLETLLDDVLTDFDLHREQAAPAATAGTHAIRAELKPGHPHPTLRAALLEIDAESRVVRRVVLWRTHQGEPLTTVTFTLLETGVQSDDSYQLEGHLQPDAKIYSRSFKPALRQQKLASDFAAPAREPAPEVPSPSAP
jgi:hypothetical protein